MHGVHFSPFVVESLQFHNIYIKCALFAGVDRRCFHVLKYFRLVTRKNPRKHVYFGIVESNFQIKSRIMCGFLNLLERFYF
jgi:hypothetical protein